MQTKLLTQMFTTFVWFYCAIHNSESAVLNENQNLIYTHRLEGKCAEVCADLPENDVQPVCLMFSRYKRGYMFFVNQCHARRSVCKWNIILDIVHPTRCINSHQYFMSVN